MDNGSPVTVEGSLRALGTLHVNSGPHQDTTSAGRFLPSPLPTELCSASCFQSQPPPWGGAKGNQPWPQGICTQRAFLCLVEAGHDQRDNQGSGQATRPLPPDPLASSWPGPALCSRLCFPSHCARPGGRELPEASPSLECIMKSPACERKGLCFSG